MTPPAAPGKPRPGQRGRARVSVETTAGDIVLGVGASHTPQMSTSAAFWAEHAARDARSSALLGPDGTYARPAAAVGDPASAQQTLLDEIAT